MSKGRQPTLFVSLGQRIGRGVVIETDLRIPRRTQRTTLRAARLLCDCGNEYVTSLQALVGKRPENQRCLSCGCLRRDHQIAAVTTHGLWGHPFFKIWEGMLARCENPRCEGYPNYGGRGISVCEAWHDPLIFVTDLSRLLGPKPEGYSIDRIDNDGNYEPGNVRWADAATQVANQRPRDPAVMGERARAIWERAEYRTLVCEYCGHDYQTRAVSDDQRFCSKKCKAADRRASGVDDVDIACHQCGGIFTANKYDKVRHCSKSCGAKCQHAGNCPAK